MAQAVPVDPVNAAARLYAEACDLTAARLTELTAQRHLIRINERDHLQPVFAVALREVAAIAVPPASAAIDLDHRLKGAWPRLGRFDAGVSWGHATASFAELKAGSHEIALMACAWDALKCAFCLRHNVGIAMFLIAAAPKALWDRRSLGLELFEDAAWDARTLRERYARGFRIWERDGYLPLRVPSRFATSRGHRRSFRIGGRDWQVGIARVEPVGEDWLDWAPLL